MCTRSRSDACCRTSRSNGTSWHESSAASPLTPGTSASSRTRRAARARVRAWSRRLARRFSTPSPTRRATASSASATSAASGSSGSTPRRGPTAWPTAGSSPASRPRTSSSIARSWPTSPSVMPPRLDAHRRGCQGRLNPAPGRSSSRALDVIDDRGLVIPGASTHYGSSFSTAGAPTDPWTSPT